MTSQHDGITIFLSEPEVERIRNTIQERLKKCSELSNNVRETRNKNAAVSQATGASLMADMGSAPDPDLTQTKDHTAKLPVLAVGQPYPPSTVSFKDLQPMKLTDLRMDTHHRGRRLTVKRVSPVVTLMARSWTMIQDEAGIEVERLEVCLHKLKHGEEVLESASVFVIKEPYFTLTDQGEATIRVDHPSDLIACSDKTLKVLASSDDVNGHIEDATTAERKARICKDEGNAALKQGDLLTAHTKYSEGLKLANREVVCKTNSDLAQDIHRNRAHVNLLLNHFDEAKADAKASLTGKDDARSKDLDTKAYYRAGRATYNLSEYLEAKGFFEEQKRLAPSDEDANVYLRKIDMRLREQITGAYDFKTIAASLSRSRPRVDVANFIENTEIRGSPGRGRGLFTNCDIPAGAIVMCEKAFCVVWGHESEALTAMTYDVRDGRIRMSPVGLTASTTQKLISNPSQIKRVMGLYGDYQGDGKDVFRIEDGSVVDTFQVHDIVSRNAFSPGSQFGEESTTNASTGLWIWASYINHSCITNAKKEFIGDLMVVRATRSIMAGEEILLSYDTSSDYDARQAALMTSWGFECNCALCSVEKDDNPTVRKKRRELAAEADTFVEKEHWANAKKLTITRAKRLAQAIDETYDGERYKGLPRRATRKIQEWLALATPR